MPDFVKTSRDEKMITLNTDFNSVEPHSADRKVFKSYAGQSRLSWPSLFAPAIFLEHIVCQSPRINTLEPSSVKELARFITD